MRLIDADKLDWWYKGRPIRRVIDEAPTVDAVPVVHGRWKPKPYYKVDGNGGVFKYCDFYLCSKCATERPIVPPYNYCPNCGARMDGEK